MERREKRAIYTGVKIGLLANEFPTKYDADPYPAVPTNKKNKEFRMPLTSVKKIKTKNEKRTLLSTIRQKYLPIRQKNKIPHSPPLRQACIFTPRATLIRFNPHTIRTCNVVH